jgi:hypothetical protein
MTANMTEEQWEILYTMASPDLKVKMDMDRDRIVFNKTNTVGDSGLKSDFDFDSLFKTFGGQK